MKTSNDPRHQARRLAISIIYSSEIFNPASLIVPTEEIIETSKEGLEIERYDKDLLLNIISGINAHKPELRDIIQKNSIDWAIDKIYKIDFSILLSSIWEIKFGQTPMKVVIDEAVELAKEFGETESPKFINGILAGVVKDI
jgi:N utilization substance protein B